MRLKLTFLLIFLNICLFGFIFYSNRAQQNRTAIDAQSRLIVEPAFAQSIQEIRILTGGDSADWILQKTAKGWETRQPYHWKANPFAIEQLLFQVESLTWESRFLIESLETANQSLADYNLLEPPLEIELISGAEVRTLRLGNPTEIGGRHYLTASGQPYVFVADQTLLQTLNRDLQEFLDPHLFSLSSEQTRALQILDRTDSNVRIRLVREGDRWRFDSPIEAPADEDRVNLLLEEWHQFRIQRFYRPEEISAQAFESNPLRLTFEGLNESENLIIVPAPNSRPDAPAFMGRVEGYPVVFDIPAYHITSLRRSQETLRETRILRSVGDRWNSLQIQTDAASLTLQRLENGRWQVLRTNEEGELISLPADEKRVADIQSFFAQLETVRFVSDAPSSSDLIRFGLNEPQRRITLRTPEGNSLQLRIGGLAPEGNLLYAHTDRSNSVFLLRPHILAVVPLNPRHYQQRIVRTLPDTDRIESVALVHRLSGLPLLESSEDPSPENAEALELLRGLVRQVEFDRFFNHPFRDPLPLDSRTELNWDYLLIAKIASGTDEAVSERTQTLYLSKRLGGTTQYLGDPQSAMVGTLPGAVIEALEPFMATFPAPSSSTAPPANPE